MLRRSFWGVCLALLCAAVAPAKAQTQPTDNPAPPSYPTLASDPDPRDFVARADARLTLLGDNLRFGGFDIGWLGARQDGSAPARTPTAFEIKDALRTARALGGDVIRARGLLTSVGCAACLQPAMGQFNDQAFATIDQVLKSARDLGLKLILPLAGGPQDCTAAAPPEQGGLCTYVAWHGAQGSAAFFTDAHIRADFIARVTTILNHVNALTGIAYRNDPAILAWENCEACGKGSDDAAVSAWSEALGQAIKATDTHHLYENGAFAGRIWPHAPGAVPAALLATPSVDIIGDHLNIGHDTDKARAEIDETLAALKPFSRAYILDSFGWGPGLWATSDDFAAMLDALFRARDVAGVLIGGLQGHAEQGGYLPAPPGAHGDGLAALYFPGIKTLDMDAAEMLTRDRTMRAFNYNMAGVTQTPAPLMVPKPEIIAVQHGHVTWRGAAGASTYSIERSPDPGLPNSWSLVCDSCATDLDHGWQDPTPTPGAWYRVMPFNVNGHRALPSDPAQSH